MAAKALPKISTMHPDSSSRLECLSVSLSAMRVYPEYFLKNPKSVRWCVLYRQYRVFVL